MRVNIMETEGWKPNLFVPGFAKCGTTALCDYLAQHPSIYVVDGKEPRTLSFGEKIPTWLAWNTQISKEDCLDFNNYKAIFSRNKAYKYRIDGSQSYSFSADFAVKLKMFSENSKIILMIREQKERMLSVYFFTYLNHWQYDFTKWMEKFFLPDMSSFLFYDKVASYYDVFKTNLLVVENDFLRKSPQIMMERIFNFLNLEKNKVRLLSSNVGTFKSLDSEMYRKAFTYSYHVALAVGNPARWILNRMGLCNEEVQNSLRRFSPTLSTINVFSAIARNRKGNKNYSKLTSSIPENISRELDEDYKLTLRFCRERNIVLSDVNYV